MNTRARRHAARCLALAFAALLGGPAAAADPPPPLWVVLVRHAEKDAGPDPQLLPTGAARAEALAAALRDAPLQAVYSTDTRRTRATAAPTAAGHGLPVTTYAPESSAELAAKLRATGGAYLIVGHSDTVPAFVATLGAGAAPPIHHEEYDRFTLVFSDGTGTPSALLLRYGAPSQLPAEPLK